MKKNILLVQSLLVFPLMTSSITLCMDKPVGTSLPAQAVPSGFKKNKKPRKRQPVAAKEKEASAATSQATSDASATSETASITEVILDPVIEENATTSGSSIDTVTAPQTAPAVEENATISKSSIDTPATPVVTPTIEATPVIETIIAAPVIEATQVEETVIAAPAVKTSKWIINELTTDEKTQAKEDLAAANDLSWNLPGLAETLSLIKLVSQNELNQVELPKEKKHFTESTTEVTPSADKAIEILAPKAILMELTPDLEQSALASTEYTGFGFASSIFNAWKSYSEIVINLLEAEQFVPSNGNHKEYFNNALEECAKNKDAASLSKILKACQSKEQYQSLQSAVHHVAPAFNYLSLELQNQTVTSNRNLAIYNQQLAEQMNRESLQLKEDLAILLNQHKERVTALTAAFDARVKNAQDDESKLKNLITGVAALNAKVIPHKERLLETHNLTIPKNSVKAIEDATHQRIRGLLTHSNMPRASVLQIDNK